MRHHAELGKVRVRHARHACRVIDMTTDGCVRARVCVMVLVLVQESTYASVVCDADQLLLLSEAGAPGAVLGANAYT